MVNLICLQSLERGHGKVIPPLYFVKKKTDIFFCENIDPQFKQVSQKFCLCSINTRRVSYCTKNEVFH